MRSDRALAIVAGSFARMREYEDRVAAARKDWMTPEPAEFFSGPEFRREARRYDYDISGCA
ncbi:hypothetical protein [Saccharothrix australiensis]|uniref:Uncharacterized protein n=1 Tax=Saccharothrix australiensis TaxID=2072 RepID=A0A495W3D3_9PSEU|nr:hypothetical protein [Saccharothrix australiensis]RKT55600.1 hypothetical protein C8E97_4280 [Saccharothrix australiensis]